jgi:hypothetical protein
MPWDGVRRIIWAKHFDEMEIIGNHHFSIGVPIKADPEFKAMLFAAGITHIDGNISIDHIYKRHREEYLSAFDDDLRCPPGSLKELTLHIGEIADSHSKLLSTGRFTSPPTSGQAYAANVLIRMRSTFHAVNQLILGGLALEAESVVRQGLEQCAWAFAVKDLNDIDRIDQTSPTKSVSLLKAHFPGAGRIYGQLSESAHASLSSQERFFSFHDGKLNISIRDSDNCREALLYSVILLDAYARISDNLLACMEHETVSFMASSNRHKYDLIERYRDQFTALDHSIYGSWRGA